MEPIYLQAEEAAYPELRMVVTMHGDEMSYAPTFDEALQRLVAGPSGPTLGGGAEGIPPEGLQRAKDAFEAYVRLMGELRFEEAATQLRALGEELAIGRPAEDAPPRPQ